MANDKPRCPVCRERSDKFYMNYWTEIVGCPACVDIVDDKAYLKWKEDHDGKLQSKNR